jgi:hypothetical protein
LLATVDIPHPIANAAPMAIAPTAISGSANAVPIAASIPPVISIPNPFFNLTKYPFLRGLPCPVYSPGFS